MTAGAELVQKVSDAENTTEESAYGHWAASLDLQIRKRNACSKLSRCRHKGPLYVKKPFYPEGDDLAHIYLLHPPGGLVSGDDLRIDIDVQEGAGALVTTPGATRIYRSRHDRALQQQHISLSVKDNASLEWFPFESIVYNDADVLLSTTVDLAAEGIFVGWEVTCFGLPASDQLFTQGAFRQHYVVKRCGRPVFVDRLDIDAGTPHGQHFLQGRAGMQGLTVSGFFMVSWGGDLPLSVIDWVSQLREEMQLLGVDQYVAITYVGHYLIARYLGNSAEQARYCFTHLWNLVRPIVLQRAANIPRIWLT